MTFGERLLKAIQHYGDKQIDLAQKIGDDRSDRINNYVKDRNLPTVQFFLALNKVYPKLNLHWLITGEGDMELVNNS